MQYVTTYPSPLGNIILACDTMGLTGLWFEDQKYVKATLSPEHIYIEDSAYFPAPLSDAVRWLDLYFSGAHPDFTPALHLNGTAFQMDVWEILKTIPHGKTMSYKEIASILANKRRLPSMSAQAVGGAVGRNPVSIIVPCHRVVGANGNLTGYAGGMERKKALLTLEGIGVTH